MQTPGLTMPSLSSTTPADPLLQQLCTGVEQAQAGAARALLRDVGASVAGAGELLAALPEDLRKGSPEGYQRHLAYADPHGSYSIMYLVWRPGQFSPVHGHKTWCTYRVLQGVLSETHYRWDPGQAQATPCGQAVRRPGDIVTATPGLRQIHRLGNAGPEVAISLHIYGVAGADIATGVNHLVASAG
ncbi:cysteine dioxygenase family protein [Bordetella sp. 2513F-2]